MKRMMFRDASGIVLVSILTLDGVPDVQMLCPERSICTYQYPTLEAVHTNEEPASNDQLPRGIEIRLTPAGTANMFTVWSGPYTRSWERG